MRCIFPSTIQTHLTRNVTIAHCGRRRPLAGCQDQEELPEAAAKYGDLARSYDIGRLRLSMIRRRQIDAYRIRLIHE